ncbi:MAG: sugar phosphate isomerase/epimerase [Akkermansiaceae bacterium]|nr:sugar phosphate isomerase/epimerase [Armatimonadota bacterium]
MMMTSTLSAFTDEAGRTCEEQIASCQRAGLKFMDLRSVDGIGVTALPVEHAQVVRGKLDAAGIGVHMFGSPIGKIDIADPLETDLQKLRHLATLAPILGCRAVRMFSYYNKNKSPLAVWKSESMERLSRLRAEAERHDLILFHENERHIFGDACANVEEIAGLRNDHFKLIFDFDNYNQGGEDVWANWLTLKDQTDAFHLKDSQQIGGSYQHTLVGEGSGQVKRILADAAGRGWSGPLTLEPHLAHSEAVLATGPSGETNASFRDMPPAESFHRAAVAAQSLLAEVGMSA